MYGVDTHDGRVGLWSDFVNGKTLSAIVRADGPFGAREAALMGIDLCKAAGAVHAAGLLHRDQDRQCHARERRAHSVAGLRPDA